jgi:hypothetical protein
LSSAQQKHSKSRPYLSAVTDIWKVSQGLTCFLTLKAAKSTGILIGLTLRRFNDAVRYFAIE